MSSEVSKKSARKQGDPNCPVCQKSLRLFGSVCKRHFNWFLRTVDEYYHDPEKFVCSNGSKGENCCGYSCVICKLKRILELKSQFKDVHKCFFCNENTVLIGKYRATCSRCRTIYNDRRNPIEECPCPMRGCKCRYCLLQMMMEAMEQDEQRAGEGANYAAVFRSSLSCSIPSSGASSVNLSSSLPSSVGSSPAPPSRKLSVSLSGVPNQSKEKDVHLAGVCPFVRHQTYFLLL